MFFEGVFIKKSYANNDATVDFTWESPQYDTLGATVSFINNSSISNSSTFFWDFNEDGNIDSNEINPTYIFEEPGVYTVTLTVVDDCLDIMASTEEVVIINDITIGLGDIDTEFISVFPNPAHNNISIIFSNLELGTLIEIIDISGRIIYTDKCHNSINKINVAHILPGIYYLNIRNGSTKSIYLEKIIIL